MSRNTDNKPGKSKKKLITLSTQTLAGILDAHCSPKVVDYLSLDVEGAEWRVMHQFPFDRYQVFVCRAGSMWHVACSTATFSDRAPHTIRSRNEVAQPEPVK